jgi:hypothetical protein
MCFQVDRAKSFDESTSVFSSFTRYPIALPFEESLNAHEPSLD